MGIVRRGMGLLLATGLAVLFYLAYDNYGQFANLSRLTGSDELRPVNAWLFEFRMPLLAVSGFLVLTGVSRLWKALKLGY